MQVVFRLENHFVLRQHSGLEEGSLIYADSNLKKATISSGERSAQISYEAPGKWESHSLQKGNTALLAEISLRPGGVIWLQYHLHRKRYTIRKNGKYSGRFDLLNRNKEELITLVPSINWVHRGHEYLIQLNEEYKNECSSLLILHAVHCTNCLLGIINGSAVPALVDV